MKLDITEKKAALTASILSVIAVVTFLNQKIMSQFNTTQNSANRGIASIEGDSQYGFKWQKELAQKLSEKSKRSIASYGEAPNKLDQVRFGLLEGKYAFRFDDNVISEIQFLAAQGKNVAQENPKFIKNYEAFIMENKDVLMPELARLKTVDSKVVGDSKEQTLEALSDSNQILGHVSVMTDANGRFLSMRFSKN